jgi:hypothetical protein
MSTSCPLVLYVVVVPAAFLLTITCGCRPQPSGVAGQLRPTELDRMTWDSMDVEFLNYSPLVGGAIDYTPWVVSDRPETILDVRSRRLIPDEIVREMKDVAESPRGKYMVKLVADGETTLKSLGLTISVFRKLAARAGLTDDRLHVQVVYVGFDQRESLGGIGVSADARKGDTLSSARGDYRKEGASTCTLRLGR